MKPNVIDVDFLRKEKESTAEEAVDQTLNNTIETDLEKLQRIIKAVDAKVYAPDIEDVTDSILSEILLEESAKKNV